MTSIDWLIVLVCLGSAAFGFWRGFAKEALSLATWLAAIWLAWRSAWIVEPWLGWLSEPELRLWVARALIFIFVLIAGAVVAWLARALIRRTALSGPDRTLGGLFGLARGALIFGLAVIVIQFAGLEQDVRWQEARLKGAGDRIADGIRYYAELGARYLQEQDLVQFAGPGGV